MLTMSCCRRPAWRPVCSSWASPGPTCGSLLGWWLWSAPWRGPTGRATWTSGPGSRWAGRGRCWPVHAWCQVTLLEGREACEVKLRAPLRFWSGRADCEAADEGGRGYKASKEEVQPRMMGDARWGDTV